MADKSITGLTAASTITGTELTKIVQGGNSRKVTLAAIIAALAPAGIDGEDGRTVLSGTGAPSGGTGVDGDFYIRTSNYVIYGPKTAGAWGTGVSLVGPPGSDGADGADGLDGTDGTSLLSGTVPPTGGVGNDGDFYLDYNLYDIYGPKTGGSWGSGTSILGTVGSDGTDGVDGVDGRTILYGTAAPTTEGQDGDFYIRTSTNFIYGPKAGGSWPAGTSLVGAPGFDGLDGVDGTDGVDGVDGRTILNGTVNPTTQGEDGDFYINTATVTLFGPKASGTWPSGIPLNKPTESIIIAVGDETTALSTGTAKVTFRMPYAFTLTAVRASLTTAQSSGSIVTVDINEGGSSILSTKLTIDNSEKTSTTANNSPVISDASLADDAEITIDVDQVGVGGAGLKVVLIGSRT
jgi:integrin beta 8